MTSTDADLKTDHQPLIRDSNPINSTGVVYLSRIPPFANPQHIRDVFSRFGPLGRVFLSPEDAAAARKRKKLKKDGRKRYVDGWVEFVKKKHAKLAARVLNNEMLGGKKNYKYHDFVWNIKFLKNFTWTQITDQIAHDKAVRDQKIRNEMSQSSKEHKFFLQKVQEAKGIAAMRKKRKRENEPQQIRRTFRQREVYSQDHVEVPEGLFGDDEKAN